MIVKNSNFKPIFIEKILNKLLKDDLFKTLQIEKTTQDFIFQRITELSEKIIIEETEILLKNSTNQYNSLRKQYAGLEKLLQEVSFFRFLLKIGKFYCFFKERP